MTVPNGIARIAERVEGVVAQANDHGIKLANESDYRNFSRWATPAITPPARGSTVRLAVDNSGYVRFCEVLGAAAAPSSSSASPALGDREMRRTSAIRIAAEVIGQFAQTHEDVRTEHLFPLADRVLAWIEQPGKGGDEPF